jgi:Flp pilus assembly protein TadB
MEGDSMRGSGLVWFVLGVAAASPGLAGGMPERTLSRRGTEPCMVFRHQAYARGLDHFATEMHLACEAIVRRRVAGRDLPDALMAVERSLEAYRRAVVARPDLSEADRLAIAADTGVLRALEAIRGRY